MIHVQTRLKYNLKINKFQVEFLYFKIDFKEEKNHTGSNTCDMNYCIEHGIPKNIAVTINGNIMLTIVDHDCLLE